MQLYLINKELRLTDYDPIIYYNNKRASKS